MQVVRIGLGAWAIRPIASKNLEFIITDRIKPRLFNNFEYIHSILKKITTYTKKTKG